MLAHFRENFFSAFSYVSKLTAVHVNQSRYDVQSIKKSVAVVRFSWAKNLKGILQNWLSYFKESKLSEVRSKIKRERNEDIFREVHFLGQLDKNLFSLKFETGPYLKIVF